MIEVIPSATRGSADHGWLKAKHTFSFAEYHNPQRMHFGPLRVINEDRIAPGKGFGTHPHKDMEILTYPISGAIEHKDNMGNGAIITAGEVQRMTAGRGVEHSEYNPSKTDELHLLQIWILPEQNGLEPGYEQKLFSHEEKHNQWRLVGSRDGRDGSLTIHQDLNLYSTGLDAETLLNFEFASGRCGFVQVVRGSVEINGESLGTGDAVSAQDQDALSVRANEDSELLLFDMA